MKLIQPPTEVKLHNGTTSASQMLQLSDSSCSSKKGGPFRFTEGARKGISDPRINNPHLT
jgi:hypothetical protein